MEPLDECGCDLRMNDLKARLDIRILCRRPAAEWWKLYRQTRDAIDFKLGFREIDLREALK